jgi:L-2-hydroxyglutarate oxidase
VSDFEPWKSGIRAQLVKRDGTMVDDIVAEKKGATLHVLNAVSPGFTCSLPFADHLVDQLMS